MPLVLVGYSAIITVNTYAGDPIDCVSNSQGNSGSCFDTALRNHNRIVFEEMSSWTPLTMYLGMKTTF